MDVGIGVRGDDEGWVLPELVTCDQYDGGTGITTPSNPDAVNGVAISQVAPGVFDIEWEDNVTRDGIREMPGVSWELATLIGGADFNDPDQEFETQLHLVDTAGVNFNGLPQFGFGVIRGDLGSGTEDGRIGGMGWGSATTVAATVRFTTAQVFSGLISTITYPIDGAQVIQHASRAAGVEAMIGNTYVSLYRNVSDVLTHHRVVGAHHTDEVGAVLPAGTDRLALIWCNAAAGSSSPQQARVRLRTRRRRTRARLDL